jgi:hypothetical protein
MKRLTILFIVAAASLGGCGPMAMPMTVRLDEQQQREVDQMWSSMLTPSDRLDRDLLLDVILSYQMFQVGVDRLHLTAEKRFAGGLAVMEIDCDRAGPPELDHFAITVVDRQGRMLRHEYYTRPEVEARIRDMAEAVISAPDNEQQQAQRRREVEGRMRRVEAATQPSPT